MAFDMKTLMFLNLIINLISAGTMLGLWFYNQKRYSGIFYWFVNMILQSVGTGLILLRGQIPDLVSIIAANLLILLGETLLFKGLGLFAGKKVSMIPNVILLTAFLLFSIFYTFVVPDITVRYILINTVGILVHVQICLLLFFHIGVTWRREAVITGIFFVIFIITSLLRIISCLFFPQSNNDFFDHATYNSLTMLVFITLNACVNICLTLMVNHRLVRELRIQEEKFKVAFHSSPYGILLTRQSDDCIYEVNEGFSNITGYKGCEVIGKTTLDLDFWVSLDDRKAVLEKLAKKEYNDHLEFPFHKKSGEIFTGRFTVKTIRINGEDYTLTSITDITEFNQMKHRLEELATHDFLTGLPNRMLFHSTFQALLPAMLKSEKMLAVLTLDIDNFKSINDLFGHNIGDRALVEFARRLESAIGSANIAARIGGDEFVVLLKGIRQSSEVTKIARNLLDELNQMFKVGRSEFHMTVSIGIALCPQDSTEMESLIFQSDKSMYYVKEHGKNNFKFYHEIE